MLTFYKVVGGLLASLAIFSGSHRALAIDLEDERNKARMAGYDLIYEARELELPQEVRDGLKQVKILCACVHTSKCV